MKKTLLLAIILLFTATLAVAANGTTDNTTLSVNVLAEAAISVSDPTTNLTSGSIFGDYTGTTNLVYIIRTGAAGAGHITLKVTGDFPAGGPSVGSPITGDTMTYACTAAAPGSNGSATACTGPVTPLTSTGTQVVDFGADARSAKAGNGATVSWDLPNDPAYKVGAYTATVQFTISAS